MPDIKQPPPDVLRPTSHALRSQDPPAQKNHQRSTSFDQHSSKGQTQAHTHQRSASSDQPPQQRQSAAKSQNTQSKAPPFANDALQLDDGAKMATARRAPSRTPLKLNREHTPSGGTSQARLRTSSTEQRMRGLRLTSTVAHEATNDQQSAHRQNVMAADGVLKASPTRPQTYVHDAPLSISQSFHRTQTQQLKNQASELVASLLKKSSHSQSFEHMASLHLDPTDAKHPETCKILFGLCQRPEGLKTFFVSNPHGQFFAAAHDVSAADADSSKETPQHQVLARSLTQAFVGQKNEGMVILRALKAAEMQSPRLFPADWSKGGTRLTLAGQALTLTPSGQYHYQPPTTEAHLEKLARFYANVIIGAGEAHRRVVADDSVDGLKELAARIDSLVNAARPTRP